MPSAEYGLLWKVKYKIEWAQGRINRDVKMHLQKVYCTVLSMEMLRSILWLIFSVSCGVFFLLLLFSPTHFQCFQEEALSSFQAL